MKVILKVTLVLMMSFSMLMLFGSFFVEKMYTPIHLTKSIENIDFTLLVEEKVPNEFKSLVKTEEFQMILDDYINAFIYYLCDDKTTYTITDETEKMIFEVYSDAFLKKYPQLSFLPSELFVDFLVDRIDLNAFLPSFEDLKKEIPQQLFIYKDAFVSRELRLKCILLFCFYFLFYCLLSKRISLYSVGISSLIVSVVISIIMRKWYLPIEYEWLLSCAEYFICQLIDVFKLCIIVAMGCFFIEWGTMYAKKIFFL